MSAWQWILIVFFLLLPIVLMLDFWPDDERVNSRGVPRQRRWQRQIEHQQPEESH